MAREPTVTVHEISKGLDLPIQTNLLQNQPLPMTIPQKLTVISILPTSLLHRRISATFSGDSSTVTIVKIFGTLFNNSSKSQNTSPLTRMWEE